MEKTITGNYASYYDRDASVSGILSVWLSAGEDKRLSAFDLYKCQVSVYNWQQPIVDPKARCAIPTSIEGMVSSIYDAEAGVISVENIMFGHSERGNISAFSLNGYGMSAYYAHDRRVEYSDAVSAVYVGRDFGQEDYDKAVEDWKRPPRDSLEHWLSTEYPSLQAYCDSLSNTVSVFFVQQPDYSDMVVVNGCMLKFRHAGDDRNEYRLPEDGVDRPAWFRQYDYHVPMTRYVVAFYKKYQSYTDMDKRTRVHLSSLIDPIGDNIGEDGHSQASGYITLNKDVMRLSALETITGEDTLSASSWILNIYKRYGVEFDRRTIIYSTAVGHDDMYTDYYGVRRYKDNKDTSSVKIANQANAKSANVVYIDSVRQVSAHTEADTSERGKLKVSIEFDLSVQYQGYGFDARTLEYDLIPVDYVNYAEFEQYHILQLKDDPVGRIDFNTQKGPKDVDEFNGEDPTLAFKYQNEIDISEISAEFPPLMSDQDRFANEGVYSAYNQNSVTDIRPVDQFVVEIDDISSKSFTVVHSEKILSDQQHIVSSGISTVVNSDLERLSGYYALKDNDFGSDDIYLYFNYNNNTANSFISPFYRYSYAIVPPGETGYVGLFNQISRASNYDISDPKRTLVSVWYSVVYLGGYRIRNISDDRPKYTAESLPLSAFLAESGLGADVAKAQAGGKPWNKDSHWLSDDWLSDCMSAGIDVND